MRNLLKILVVLAIVFYITMLVIGVLAIRSSMELGELIENYISGQFNDVEKFEIVTADSKGIIIDVYSDNPGIDRMHVSYETLAIYGE